MSLRRRNDPTHTRAQKDVESETESKIQQKPGHGSDNSRVIYLLAASFILIVSFSTSNLVDDVTLHSFDS